jgi:hypothetical protein
MNIIRNVTTGTYHIGTTAGDMACNYSGQARKRPRITVPPAEFIKAASDACFCKKCFDAAMIQKAKA